MLSFLFIMLCKSDKRTNIDTEWIGKHKINMGTHVWENNEQYHMGVGNEVVVHQTPSSTPSIGWSNECRQAWSKLATCTCDINHAHESYLDKLKPLHALDAWSMKKQPNYMSLLK